MKKSMMTAKNISYYENSREEIIPFIPKKAKKLLEVGVGNGNFAELLISHNDIEILECYRNQVCTEKAGKKVDKLKCLRIQHAMNQYLN